MPTPGKTLPITATSAAASRDASRKGAEVSPESVSYYLLDILERDLRAILRRKPDDSQALNDLGYTLADRTNRLDEAYQLIEKALKLSPDDAAILDSMGWVLFRQRRNTDAIGFLKQAYAQQRDSEIAAHLGEVLWVTGQKDEARKVWNEALKQSPENKVLRQTINRLTQRHA